MKKIEWKDEYNLDISMIDRQHQKLFDYLNILRQGILEHNAIDAIKQGIQDLYDYGREHFSFEESLMKKGGFPILLEHIETHKSFNREIKTYQDRFEAGNEIMATDLILFIKNWLLNHILVEDRKYADFFRENSFHCPEMDR